VFCKTGETSHFSVHIVQRYRSPSTYPPQQQGTICCKYLSLTLLMMGKISPETCWADLIDQYIIVASSWFIYVTLSNGHSLNLSSSEPALPDL